MILIAAGSFYKLVNGTTPPSQQQNYTKQDSLFFRILGDTAVKTPSNDSLFNSSDSASGMAEIKKASPHKGNIPEKSIDINHASVKELTLLPGVGEKTAEKIIVYRNQTGRFSNVEQIMEVNGIGEKKFDKMKRFILIR